MESGLDVVSQRRHERSGPAISNRPPQAFRDRTTVLRGCTGRGARAPPWAMRPGALARYQLTIADYHNTYYGRLAEKLLQKQGALARAEPSRVRASARAARRRRR